jgi:hypothetical protein
MVIRIIKAMNEQKDFTISGLLKEEDIIVEDKGFIHIHFKPDLTDDEFIVTFRVEELAKFALASNKKINKEKRDE